MSKASFFFVLLLWGYCFTSHGFPESIRHGYQSCSACHKSPTGGAMLSTYGRQLSGELLSGTSSKDEAAFAYGELWGSLEQESTKPFSFQANFRHGQVYQDRQAFTEYRSIIMQVDAEASYTSGPWTGQISAGVYGGSVDAPSLFARYEFNENFSLRAGRFFPAYGIRLEDHRAAIRRGLGYDQGEQTFNVEALYQAEWGELYFTPILGKFFPSFTGRGKILGLALRGGLNIGETSQVGVNVQWSQTDLYNQNTGGVFALLGFSKAIYFLAEVDVRGETPRAGTVGLPGKTGIFTYGKLGWEFIQGYHLFLKQEIAHPSGTASRGRSDYYGLGLRILPRPHININLQAGGRLIPALSNAYGFESVLTLHFYL